MDILDQLQTRFDPRIVQPDEMARAAHAEIKRLRDEVVTLAKLGDFSGLRPNSDVLKLVVRLKRAGRYELKARD